jgi:hypothetical protein
MGVMQITLPITELATISKALRKVAAARHHGALVTAVSPNEVRVTVSPDRS